MKIAIITLPIHTNIGGILQAYALQTVLRNLGHSVDVVVRPTYMKDYRFYFLKLLKRSFLCLVSSGCKFKDILYENRIKREYSIIGLHTIPFIEKYIKRRVISNWHELKYSDYDTIIVGSDQIWRPKYFQDIEQAYLLFAKKWNIKRLTYAVSFGTNKWEYSKKITRKCLSLSQKFDNISVREDSGVYLCEKYLNVEASHVLDPTMLLDIDCYLQLANSKRKNETVTSKLFVYILDYNKKMQTVIDVVSKHYSLSPTWANNPYLEREEIAIEKRIALPVEEWLNTMIDSEVVLTDSFHATVFSILFNKTFWVYLNESRGADRIKSLLKIFKLEDRLILETKDFNKKKMNGKIEWDTQNKILREWKKKSMDYLIYNLK